MKLLVVFFFLLSCLPAGLSRAEPKRKNIVFILIDDLRYDTFSFMGHPFVETPHIDSLAGGGLHFRNAFVTTSLCSPARASFLTGQYMHRHLVVDNATAIPPGTQTFPQYLQTAGYRTAFIGKWHMGGSSDAPRPGFDHWVSFRGQGTYESAHQSLNVDGQLVPRKQYMTDELTDYAARWLQQQTQSDPFLLYLSHKGVHGLYDPAERHRDRYRNVEFALPDAQTRHPRDAGLPMWVQDQQNSWHGVEFAYHGRAHQSIAEMYRHYCEMILSIDESVGTVMETLRTTGLLEDTLVIFTSDGGHLWGEHGLIDKRCAYEESIRIPMLAHCPSLIPPNSISEAIVRNIDVAPTLLELAGLSILEPMDGTSFLSLLHPSSQDGSSEPSHGAQESERARDDFLLYEYYWEPSFPQTPTTFALRQNRYKLIQYHGIWDTDELYDLVDDPRETRNLIHDSDMQTIVTSLRSQLHDRLQASDGFIIPLGIKQNHGSNRRSAKGSLRAEFPASMLSPDSLP